jgi:hypothetical protein
MATLVQAVDRPELGPYRMPARFKHDISYFMAIPGENGIPLLPAGEYWIPLDDARRWLDQGVFYLVSPLDSANRTEVELSEEQEGWLEWLVEHQVERVRISTSND